MTTILVIVIVLVVGFLGLFGYISLMERKCPSCKKNNAMIEISRVLIDKMPTTIKETRKKKNKNGKVISSWTVDLPATKCVYNVTLKCKYCGYVINRTEESVRKN